MLKHSICSARCASETLKNGACMHPSTNAAANLSKQPVFQDSSDCFTPAVQPTLDMLRRFPKSYGSGIDRSEEKLSHCQILLRFEAVRPV